MKTIYILEQRIMNGTVTLNTMTSGFTSKELAEKCKEVLDEANKDIFVKVFSSIKEMNIYEKEDECDCLKGNI